MGGECYCGKPAIPWMKSNKDDLSCTPLRESTKMTCPVHSFNSLCWQDLKDVTNSTHYETYRCRKLTTTIESGAAEVGVAAQARPLAQLEGGVAAQLRPLAQPVAGGRMQHGELVEMSRSISLSHIITSSNKCLIGVLLQFEASAV